jgi:hypothetical protein
MDKMSIYTVFQRIACVPVHNSNDAVIFYDELQKFTHSIIYAMGHPCVQSEDILRIVKQLDTIKSCLIDMERKLPSFRVEQQKPQKKVVASLTKKLDVDYPGVAANAQRDLDKIRLDDEKEAMEAQYDLQNTLQQGEHTAELIRIATEQLQMGQEDHNHPTESIHIAEQHDMSQEDHNHDPTESIRIAEQHAMSQEDYNHDPTESIRIAEQHAMSQEDYNVITLLKEQRKHLKKQRHLSKKSMTIPQEPEKPQPSPQPQEPQPQEPQPQEPPPQEPQPQEPPPQEPPPQEPLPKEPPPKEPQPKEPEPKEPEPKEPEPKEPEPKEPEPKEPEPKEPEPKEPLPKEPLPQEPEPKEPQPKEPQPKEPLPQEPEPKEPQPKEPPPKEPQPQEPLPKEPKVKSRKKPKKKSIDPDLELLEKECIRVATENHVKSSNEKHIKSSNEKHIKSSNEKQDKSPAVKITYKELLHKCGVDVNDDMFDDGKLHQFQEDYELCRNKIGESTYTTTFHSELGITGFKPGMIINRIMQASEVGSADDMKDTMVLALLVEIDHIIMSQTSEQFNFIKMFIRSITVKKYLQDYIKKDLSKKQQVLSLEWYQEWCKKHMNPKVLEILINLIHHQLEIYYTTTEQLMKAYITHST